MTFINDFSGVSFSDSGLSVEEPVAPPVPETPPPPTPAPDVYASSGADFQAAELAVVLPYEEPVVSPPPDFVQAPSSAESVLNELTTSEALANDPAAKQIAAALDQLLQARTPGNAVQLDAAIAYYASLGQSSLDSAQPNATIEVSIESAAVPEGSFDENADFVDNMSDDVLSAWGAVDNSAAQNLDAIVNGNGEVSPDMVAALNENMAEDYWSQAADAVMAGNDAAAVAAAEAALSHVASMEAAGADTSQLDGLVHDMQGVIDSGGTVMNTEHVGSDASIEPGAMNLINSEGQAVTLDPSEVADVLQLDRPEGSPPLVDSDPTTDVGYDGAGMDLSGSGSTSESSGGSESEAAGDSGGSGRPELDEDSDEG